MFYEATVVIITVENCLNFFDNYIHINIIMNLLKILINDFVLEIYVLILEIIFLNFLYLNRINNITTKIKGIHLDECLTVFFVNVKYTIRQDVTNDVQNYDDTLNVVITNHVLSLKILDVI